MAIAVESDKEAQSSRLEVRLSELEARLAAALSEVAELRRELAVGPEEEGQPRAALRWEFGALRGLGGDMTAEDWRALREEMQEGWNERIDRSLPGRG